jgi:Hemerythrin HHE cation binding domain
MPVDVSRLSTWVGDPLYRRYPPIRCEAAVIVPDVIHALLHDHDQMRRLCTDVRQAGGTDKKGLFAELYQLVNVHELGDLAVVHPAARRYPANGNALALACMREGADIARALAELHALGVEHAAFDSKLATVHQAIHDHTAHEERDEFPLLRRYVSTQRLHMMTGELHDVQAMGTN